jgi:hypothetical protein
VTLETHLINEGGLSLPQGSAEAVRLEVALLIQGLERQHLHHSSHSRDADEGGASSLDVLLPAGHSGGHQIKNDPGHSRGSPRRGVLIALVV